MRFGAKPLMLAGLALFAAGLAIFTRAPVEGTYAAHVLPVMLLLGTGAGLCFPALMTLAMSGATAADAGLASVLINTAAQVGGAFGLAVLATVATSRSERLVADGEDVASALTTGYHLAFWVGTALVAAAIAVALLVVRPSRPDEVTSDGLADEGMLAATGPRPEA